jgi:uncharacterized RDD family membrane protein YckC
LSHSATWPPSQPAPAGFFVRTWAYLIDAFLLSLVGGAFPFLVITSTSEQIENGRRVTTGAGGSILVSLIYFVVFWSHLGGGRTLGMRLLKLRVIAEDGSQIGVVNAFIRWLGLWLSIGLCFIGVIWVAFDSRHQAWHDKIAKTLVVHSWA